MSDPMTNVEIEDVLSSIRRMVAQGTQDQAATPPAKPRQMPKLVLTPALRVDAPSVIEDSHDDVPVMLGHADRVDVGTVPSAVKPVLTDRTISPVDRDSLLATIAELEAAVREQPDDWEPDGTGTDTDLSWARAGFRGDVEVEDAQELPLRSAPANAAAWPPTLVEAARRYGSNAAELDGDACPAAEFWHHRPENIVRPDTEDDDFDDDLIGGPELGDDPEDMLESYLAGAPVIDATQLREMVRDIVREELQGKLGERITRNVRKLVRREIHRVLTTQTFD